MVYDINIFRKDVTRPLFTVGFLGLCLFLNFIKTLSEKEIKDVEEIIIKPYEQVFEIDIIPKVSKKMFSLGGNITGRFHVVLRQCVQEKHSESKNGNG